MGHLAAMTLYAALLGVFFATLWRRERGAQVKLFLQIFGACCCGAVAARLADVLLPVGAAGADSMTSGGLLVVAGEASGDLHGARLLAALGRRLPGLERLRARLRRAARRPASSGSPTAARSRWSGWSRCSSILPRARRDLPAAARRDRAAPARAPRCSIDFPDFNLRLARELAWRGIPVVYYVSPQIWAWRRGRVRTIAECVAQDARAVRLRGRVLSRPRRPGRPRRPPAGRRGAASCRRPGRRSRSGARSTASGIALLPGSRRSELRRAAAGDGGRGARGSATGCRSKSA